MSRTVQLIADRNQKAPEDILEYLKRHMGEIRDECITGVCEPA